MTKSFGYDYDNQSFRIARHEVGDFGLHLSLVRSFSWGNNIPTELPFFPGKPLPYHYYFDFVVGILERLGVRIDVAFNGVSIGAFTFLLFLIYKLPQVIFLKSKILGILSVIFFIFHSSMTFLDFFKGKSFSLDSLKDLWLLPDYLNKGPFDGSIISIFFTLNVFLNQRHLVLGLTISLAILLLLISPLLVQQKISSKYLILLGLIVGFSSRIHTLIFIATMVVTLFLFIVFKRPRLVAPFFLPAVLVFSPHLAQILSQEISHPFFNPGFLAIRPLTPASFVQFWWLNLGIALVTIPLGFAYSTIKQRKFFFSILPLFIFGNLFQFGFRIDHNHSIFNFFLILANFYTAFLLLVLWRGKILKKILVCMLLSLMTASGVIDLMAVKNDFQLSLADAPNNAFMQWIKTNTNPNDVFLSRQEILDPVTLSGRKNYFGHKYYLSVMGYDFSERERLTKTFFEVDAMEIVRLMRREGIKYLVLPRDKIADFTYQINEKFLKENLKIDYQDGDVLVFKL